MASNLSTRAAGGPGGGSRLEQRVVAYPAGRSERPADAGAHVVLFVARGHGTLHLNGSAHELEPETGVFVAAGETAAIETDGLEAVEVRVSKEVEPTPTDRRVVRCREQPALDAGIGREFHYLVNEQCGIAEVTQFVGTIPPGPRAPMHTHDYEEVLYVVDGEGAVHWGDDGTTVELEPGSCVHFPPGRPHSLENTGAGTMRVMGVFHPQGSPAARSEDGNNLMMGSSNS